MKMIKNEDATKFFDSKNYIFNENSKLGIYIIHGFSSTTYEVKELLNHLCKLGFYVEANNLPGHGTTIDDCNHTKYTDWISFVEQDIARMYIKCDKVIVMGVSMGGLLAMNLAITFPLDGIVIAGSLLKFKKEFDVRIITRLFHKFKPKVIKKYQFDKYNMKHVDFYGYNAYPIIALNEMRKLVDNISIKLDKIKCPVLMIHSKDDKTALYNKNFQLIKNKLSNASVDSLVLDDAGHHLFDPDKKNAKIIFEKISTFVARIFNV